ncbi:MAG TPA: DUF4124 domain-containing protein, partial [Xanthomonadaceae bacterium]|nr:DUF4124 domain-containing protein [Xanthomonadaceae bacterium]
MAKSSIITLVAAIGLLAGTSVLGETVYKWKDANGQSHYSQQPPEGTTKYEAINTAGDTVDDSSDTSQPKADSGAQNSGGSAAATGDLTPAQAQRQQLCKSARDNAATLTTHATVNADINGDGKPVTLNAAQHDAALSDANKQVDLYCSK